MFLNRTYLNIATIPMTMAMPMAMAMPWPGAVRSHGRMI